MKPIKNLLSGCLIALAVLFYSCQKEDPPTIPIVETVIITDITQSTATGGGQIVSEGGKPVTKRGVCWGETNQPTINDDKTTDGAGDGTFVSSIAGLAPGVLYYVRAYATNGVGTGYGEPVSFKTSPVALAELTTAAISEITANSANSGGTLVSNGGGEISACGVCWSLAREPKVTDNKTTDAISGNSFTSTLTNLEYFKTYYVRAYATNPAGTVYGNEREFKTAAVPPTVTTGPVTNRSYRSATVDGEVTADGGNPVTDKGICYATHLNPKFNENNKTAGNGLGPFTADLTGLEPNTVYHVRAYAATSADTTYGADVEFRTLELGLPQVTTKSPGEYVDLWSSAITGGEVIADGGSEVTVRGVCWSVDQEPTVNDMHRTNGGGLGKFECYIFSEEMWPPYIYHVRAYASNSTGTAYGNQVSFSVLCSMEISDIRIEQITGTSVILAVDAGPAEVVSFEVTNKLSGSSQSIQAYGGGGPLITNWGASINGLTLGTEYSVTAHAQGLCGGRTSNPISFTTLNTPSLTTIAASAITSNSVISGGVISSDGGSLVTERGVCWGKNTNPTLGDYHRTSGSGTGPFSVTINGLEENTEYHLRSYATNGIGTAYGQDEVFKTGLAPITDIDGNSYKVVQIGTQIWMAENLKTTTFKNGAQIQLVTDFSQWANLTSQAYCWYNNSVTNKDKYGALYNWYAVATDNLCPTGWHVPTDAEWTILTNFLGGETGAGGKLKEIGITHWNSPNSGATNEYGFTALPGGYRSMESGSLAVGLYGLWWSSTSSTASNAWYRSMYFDDDDVYRSSFYPVVSGLSIRCIKD